MNLDDQRFAHLLRESTPEPPFDISLEAVVRQRDRRRIASRSMIAVAAVAALIAAFAGVPDLLQRGTLIRVAEAADNLSVEYHGVTFTAPDEWQLGEAPSCGLPQDKSVIVGPSWATSHCVAPEPRQAPTWVWLTQISNADLLGSTTWSRGKARPSKIDIDGQPAYLQQQAGGSRGYVVALPWMGVRAEIRAPSDAAARDLVSQISADATDETLAVPADANTVVVQAYPRPRSGGETRQTTVGGRSAAAIIAELRSLEIRRQSDPRCTPTPDTNLNLLTVYGPSREHRMYVVRGGDCAETYGGTGVAGATSRTLRSLIDQQLK